MPRLLNETKRNETKREEKGKNMTERKEALSEGSSEINKPLLAWNRQKEEECLTKNKHYYLIGEERFSGQIDGNNRRQHYGCFDNDRGLVSFSEKERSHGISSSEDYHNSNSDGGSSNQAHKVERKSIQVNDKIRQKSSIETITTSLNFLSPCFQLKSIPTTTTTPSNQNKTYQTKQLDTSGNKCSPLATMGKVTKFIGILLIVLLCTVCIYETWNWRKENQYKTRVRMVNVISRHGDRAPADGFQLDDTHQDRVVDYWPNGLHNLTNIGIYRQYRVGLKLRELYKDYLGFNSSEILALSSPVHRCYHSLQETLKGLFDVEFNRYSNLRFIKKYEHCFLTSKQKRKLNNNITSYNNSNDLQKKSCRLTKSRINFAIANEWKNIPIYTKIVPTLTWEYLDNCPWKVKNPFKVDKDALLSPNISKLKGIKKLERILIDNYNHTNLNYSMTHVWSTILAELNVFHTQTTYNDTNHYIHWINELANDEQKYGKENNNNNYTNSEHVSDDNNVYENVADDDDENAEDDEDEEDDYYSEVTLYDLLEEATIQIYNDRIKGPASLIQNGPILTSLIDSQLVAMKQYNRTHNKNSIHYYKDKKLILYSTHDSIIINILSALDMIDFGHREIFMQNMPYESRFRKYHNEKSDVVKLLQGIRMPAFGSSLRFELIELESLDYDDDNGNDKLFYYVQLFIYNNEDGKYGDVDYKLVELGTMCQRRYLHLHPHSTRIDTFYDPEFQFDKRFGCPFELFKNLTSEFLISQEKLEEACNKV